MTPIHPHNLNTYMSNLAFEYQIREPKIKLDKNPPFTFTAWVW
jgi:hypothetical protein